MMVMANDSGIAVRVINVDLKFNKNKKSIMATIIDPSLRASFTLLIEFSMK